MEPARDAVVRPLSRAVARPCARPGCPSPASATLSFRYTSREAWLAPLAGQPAPETYDLCRAHADRTRPPHNWQLVDRRPAEDPPDRAPSDRPEGFGGEGTVAVLRAAMRPEPVEPPPALGADRSSPPDVTIEDPPRPDGEDDDLAAVLTALVAELEAAEPAGGERSPQPRPPVETGGGATALVLDLDDEAAHRRHDPAEDW